MAICPKCGTGKATKRKDGFYCRRHGFVRKINTPFYLLENHQDDRDRPSQSGDKVS